MRCFPFIVIGQKKVGKKKLAKMQMKEERKKGKEVSHFASKISPSKAEEQMKQERKKREEQQLDEQKLLDDKKKQEERELEIEEERRLLEKKQREEEEYNQWKNLIAVEETGTVQAELEEREKRMGELIQHVKDNKVVLLEDLAVEFSMKTHVCCIGWGY
jgi:cell division protein FtsN